VAVVDAWGAGDGAADRRVERARDGVRAQSEGRGPAAPVAPIRGRRLAAQAEAPPLGAVRARRAVCALGPAEALAARLHQRSRAAGGERLPSGARRGDGAPWSGTVADAHGPGGRLPLDDAQRRAPLEACAALQSPNDPAAATA
jgi:hypothetical protein